MNVHTHGDHMSTAFGLENTADNIVIGKHVEIVRRSTRRIGD
jgi:hypothetical protein